MTSFGGWGANPLTWSTGPNGVTTIHGGVTIPTAAQQIETDGCAECNRTDSKPWPVYTVNYHGVECCAKCLTPMSVKRRRRV